MLCKSVEEVVTTIKLDPKFEGFFRTPPFTVRHLADRIIRRGKGENLRSNKGVEYRLGYSADYFGDRPACEIKSAEVLTWASSMMKDYAYRTVSVAVLRLNGLYLDAIKYGLLDTNPCAGACKLYPYKRGAAATAYPSDDEERCMLENTPRACDRVLLRLALEAGLGSYEVAALKHSSFEGSLLRIDKVRNDQPNTSEHIVDANDHRKRIIPVSSELSADIAEIRLEDRVSDDSFLFTGDGRAFTPQALVARVNRILTAAGLGTWIKVENKRRPRGAYTFDNLSSRAAVKWLQAGVNPVLLMRRMGYGDFGAFQRRYSAVLNALPPGPGIAAVDDLIWNTPDHTTQSACNALKTER